MRIFTTCVGMLLAVAAVPAGAQVQCSLEVSALVGPVIFSDGFESGDLGAWQGPEVARFSAVATEDLLVRVGLGDGFDGEQATVHLRFLLPSGGLFQETSIPVVVAGSRSGGAAVRRVPGYPFPVREQILTAVETERGLEHRVEVRFPVAGTQILWNSLYGEWRVEAYVDDAAAPCSEAATFTITE